MTVPAGSRMVTAWLVLAQSHPTNSKVRLRFATVLVDARW
jgi:hypothetical protein